MQVIARFVRTFLQGLANSAAPSDTTAGNRVSVWASLKGAINVVLRDASHNAVGGAPGSASPAGAVQVAGTDGSTLRAWSVDSGGRGKITITSSGGDQPALNSTIGGGSDSVAAVNAIATMAIMYAQNDSSQDRWRNNTEGTLLASAARTTDTTATLTDFNASAFGICVNVTVAGTGALTPTIKWVNPATGGMVNLLVASTTITGTGRFGYQIGPGVTGSAGVGSTFLVQSASFHPGRSVAVVISHSDASSWTYSVGYVLGVSG